MRGQHKTTDQEFDDFVRLVRRMYAEAPYPDFVSIAVRAALAHRLAQYEGPASALQEYNLDDAVFTLRCTISVEAGRLHNRYLKYRELADA